MLMSLRQRVRGQKWATIGRRLKKISFCNYIVTKEAANSHICPVRRPQKIWIDFKTSTKLDHKNINEYCSQSLHPPSPAPRTLTDLPRPQRNYAYAIICMSGCQFYHQILVIFFSTPPQVKTVIKSPWKAQNVKANDPGSVRNQPCQPDCAKKWTNIWHRQK